jgi:hypothetical protein
MDEFDWDDPAVEEGWCNERRQQVTEYLSSQGVLHGGVGEWPAWHVTPYVSIWAIQSLLFPGSVGWWAICGDLPTDYISAASVKHPRLALRTFSENWKEVAACMFEGRPHPSTNMGPPEKRLELAPLLESRSAVLRQFAEDDSVWGSTYD